MLEICATETAFITPWGDLYKMINGCAMGCCLAPTMADFYMSHVEETVFSTWPTLRPKTYSRYVDDIFITVNNFYQILEIRDKMQQVSRLNFTYELEVKKKLPFLDVLVNRNSLSLKTSVFVKPTNISDTLNYNSVCCDNIKSATIRTTLNRSFYISSDWKTFIDDLPRIKQLLTNNNYPMKIIEHEIKKFIEIKVKNNLVTRKKPINLFFQHRFSSNYKNEEKKLKTIINDNIFSVDKNEEVRLNIYYKSKKLRNLFIRNSSKVFVADGHAVYQYTCPSGRCNSSNYIGYTVSSLKQRFTNHAQTGSIKKHITENHPDIKANTKELLKNVKVIFRANCKYDLILAEGILIKQHKPDMNEQHEFSTRTLKIF